MRKMSKIVKIGLNLPMSDETVEWIEKYDPELAKTIREHKKKRSC